MSWDYSNCPCQPVVAEWQKMIASNTFTSDYHYRLYKNTERGVFYYLVYMEWSKYNACQYYFSKQTACSSSVL